jgi:dethiobiotin synthetase/adenosylmethionine--8-amino-7-oxononanoate aminotransferase
MTLLYRNLRVHQIFGTNTDVGKTIFATALVRTSARWGHNVLYLKPVSTGGAGDADDLYASGVNFLTPQQKILIASSDRHVRRFSGSSSGRVEVDCLFRYNEPVSPHLAILRQEGKGQVSISLHTSASDTHTFYRSPMAF